MVRYHLMFVPLYPHELLKIKYGNMLFLIELTNKLDLKKAHQRERDKVKEYSTFIYLQIIYMMFSSICVLFTVNV